MTIEPGIYVARWVRRNQWVRVDIAQANARLAKSSIVVVSLDVYVAHAAWYFDTWRELVACLADQFDGIRPDVFRDAGTIARAEVLQEAHDATLKMARQAACDVRILRATGTVDQVERAEAAWKHSREALVAIGTVWHAQRFSRADLRAAVDNSAFESIGQARDSFARASALEAAYELDRWIDAGRGAPTPDLAAGVAGDRPQQ